jgi:hypothetical protein
VGESRPPARTGKQLRPTTRLGSRKPCRSEERHIFLPYAFRFSQRLKFYVDTCWQLIKNLYKKMKIKQLQMSTCRVFDVDACWHMLTEKTGLSTTPCWHVDKSITNWF